MGQVPTFRATQTDMSPVDSNDELSSFDAYASNPISLWSSDEEVMRRNSLAEPGQRLQDVPVPEKMAGSIQKVSSELLTTSIRGHEHRADHTAEGIMNGHTQPSITKQMNHYIRKHPFFEKSLATFTKSERRQFERNVYDFARGLGLKKAEARSHVVKAREFCGEEQYDSDISTFENEIDDSRSILESLSASNLNGSAAVSMANDLPTCQVDRSEKTRAAHDIPSKSREDAASKSTGTNPPSKRRKARVGRKDHDNESAGALLELSKAHDFPTNVGEDAASMSAGTNPASKKRKTKAGGVDVKSGLDMALLEASKYTAQWATDWTDVGKVAGRDVDRERKRQKRLKLVKHDKIEPQGDKEYLNEWANPQEPGSQEGARRSEKKGKYPSLNTPLKPKAFTEQRDNQLMAEESQRPRKGRKRRRHRRDEMTTDVISSSGNEKTKSSTQRNPASGENASDEPSSLQSEVQRMERQDF